MKHTIYALTMFALAACTSPQEEAIDRHALVTRNNPEVTAMDSLSSLSVGNGEFAYTVDATGLQTFPEVYKNGVPLGTQSQWGWHSFGNPENYKPEEALVEYDFGHGHKELYATQPKEPGRAKEASDWYRVNPHRLHLGIIGLELENEVRPSDVQNIQQSLDMWNGIINSRFTLKETPYHIQTVCHPERDMIAARLSARQPAGIKFHFPYPTGGHCDDACNWEANDKHSTTLVSEDAQSAVLKRTLDATTYYVTISWEGAAKLREKKCKLFRTHANGQCIYIHLPIHTASVRCSHPDFCGSTTSLFRTLAKLLDTGSCCRLLTMYGCPCQRIGTPGRIKPISARHPMCRINPATGNRTDLQLLVREIPFGNDLVASGTIRLMGTSRITGPHFILGMKPWNP